MDSRDVLIMFLKKMLRALDKELDRMKSENKILKSKIARLEKRKEKRNANA